MNHSFTVKKLTCFLIFAFLLSPSCDEEEIFIDEFSLVSYKWKLVDYSGGCIEGPGFVPGNDIIIFRPGGEFIARDYMREVRSRWNISQANLIIRGAKYSLRKFNGVKLVLNNKGCISTYVAVGLDEIYNQGASSISQHSATLRGTFETNFPENLNIEIEYGYTSQYGKSITLDNVPTPGYPPAIVSAEITGLVPGTRYHYILRATKENGDFFYGPPMTFQTFNENQLQDVDGNFYNTVTIDNRVWMAENLRVTRLRDGTPIPNVNYDRDVWENLSEPVMALNTLDPCGAYYNWYAAETDQLCPAGWHVPTQEDWGYLLIFLESNQKYKLMEASSVYWPNNTPATNESGFSALGCSDDKSFATFWTAINSDPLSDPYYTIQIDLYEPEVNKEYTNKWQRNCVRCIRD